MIVVAVVLWVAKVMTLIMSAFREPFLLDF
jgi:hypothetical protein